MSYTQKSSCYHAKPPKPPTRQTIGGFYFGASMQLPNHLMSFEIMRERQQTDIDRAIVRNLKTVAEGLRKKRADHDEVAFMRDRSKEVWQ